MFVRGETKRRMASTRRVGASVVLFNVRCGTRPTCRALCVLVRSETQKGSGTRLTGCASGHRSPRGHDAVLLGHFKAEQQKSEKGGARNSHAHRTTRRRRESASKLPGSQAQSTRAKKRRRNATQHHAPGLRLPPAFAEQVAERALFSTSAFPACAHRACHCEPLHMDMLRTRSTIGENTHPLLCASQFGV